MKPSFPSLVVAATLALATPALAHHSAAQYDFSKPETVEGTVRDIKVQNPHSHLVLEVKDSKGVRAIAFEGHSRNNIYRRGWRPSLVKVGDHLTIDIAPRRAGAEGGYIVDMRTDGGLSF